MILSCFASLWVAACFQATGEKVTEVIFVGTQHFISDMPQGYTPGHLRALLAKINPAVLAVEAPFNTKNPWDSAPLELQWVTKPWADKNRVPVVAVGWHDPFYGMRIQNMVGQIQRAGKAELFQKLEARFKARLSDVTCAGLNGENGLDLWRGYHKELRDLNGKETPWETLNAKVVENLRGLIREHRGKRIAIVFGAAHGYFLLDALAEEAGVKAGSSGALLPLSEKEIAEHTIPKDHLLALRMLNLGGVAPEKLQELEGHLAALKGVPEFRDDYELFSGKFLLHKGEVEAALAKFRRVASLGDDVLSSFDGSSRLNEAAAIYAAISLSRLSRPAEAQVQLKGLLGKENLSKPMKDLAEERLLREYEPGK